MPQCGTLVIYPILSPGTGISISEIFQIDSETLKNTSSITGIAILLKNRYASSSLLQTGAKRIAPIASTLISLIPLRTI